MAGQDAAKVVVHGGVGVVGAPRALWWRVWARSGGTTIGCTMGFAPWMWRIPTGIAHGPPGETIVAANKPDGVAMGALELAWV